MERHMTVPSRALVIVSTIVVLALALLLVLASGASAGSGEAASVATVDYRVRAGDTLWLIADQHAVEGQDIRSVVEQIRRINGLESGVIQAGQVLAVPRDA